VAKSSGPLIIGLGAAALLLMGGKKKSRSSKSNFYDYSMLKYENVTPEKLSKMLASVLTEKKVLVVVTDRSNKELTNHVRDIMRWGASKRRDINFVIIDCNTAPDAEFNCPAEAWNWEFGPPMQQSAKIGRVDESFENAVKEIVEG